MASKMLRRSGVAVGLMAEQLNWEADWVIQVGVGQTHEEATVLREEWPACRFLGFDPLGGSKSPSSYPGEIREIAIGASPGSAELSIPARHKDGSSLYPIECNQVKTVRVSTLDEQLQGHIQQGARVLLWLDCEGSELSVLEGGVEFLNSVQMVNVEITTFPPAIGWSRPVDVHQKLVDYGFFAQWCHTQRICSTPQADFIYVRRELFRPELCCFPWETQRYTTAIKGANP